MELKLSDVFWTIVSIIGCTMLLSQWMPVWLAVIISFVWHCIPFFGMLAIPAAVVGYIMYFI